jgi:hypothetical protein
MPRLDMGETVIQATAPIAGPPAAAPRVRKVARDANGNLVIVE